MLLLNLFTEISYNILMPTLYILAGANGSGKSTIARELLPTEGLVYVNADDIARELCPQDMQRARIQAGREVHRRMEELFSRKISFALESTLSGNGHIKTLQQARANGYRVILIYVFVDNAAACLARIKSRVLNGGHPVPQEDVIRRFARSKTNFWHKYKSLADEWYLYYNGMGDISLVSQQIHARPMQILSDDLFALFTEDL